MDVFWAVVVVFLPATHVFTLPVKFAVVVVAFFTESVALVSVCATIAQSLHNVTSESHGIFCSAKSACRKCVRVMQTPHDFRYTRESRGRPMTGGAMT